jgi:Spy/CpxP family protein refolding chaperone
MTTRIKTLIAAGAAVLTLAAGAPLLMAQDQPQRRQGPGFGGPPPGGGPGMPGMRRGGPMGGPMGFGPGFRELNLTDDQKAQLKQIAESHRDEFRAAGEKARAAHEGMRALIESDSIDENAIRAKSQEVAAAEAEMMILNAKVRQQSLQVLTSEQQAKLKELRDSRPGPGRGGPRPRKGQK